MQQTVVDTTGFRWIDVVAPTPGELEALAAEHQIHPLAIQDCLEPEHLPKHEVLGPFTFVILRAFDENASPAADTVHKLTRKVALFFDGAFLLSVHRAPQRFLEELKQKPPVPASRTDTLCELYVLAIANGVIDSFWKPLDDAEARIAAIEEREGQIRARRVSFVHEVFHLKRRIGAIRSTSRHILETVKKLTAAGAQHLPPSPHMNDLRENAESLYFATDEIQEDANSLLTLTLAAADHESNQITRVLTIFAAFFLPLTFIVGIYGMNFDVMPELRWRYGYPLVLASMAAIAAGIYVWFRRKGWM
jgi:magnesium transporter